MQRPLAGATTLPLPRFTDIELQCQKSMSIELEDTERLEETQVCGVPRVPSHGPLTSQEAGERVNGGGGDPLIRFHGVPSREPPLHGPAEQTRGWTTAPCRLGGPVGGRGGTTAPRRNRAARPSV